MTTERVPVRRSITPTNRSTLSRAALCWFALAGLAGISSCGSDGSSATSASATAGTGAPEDIKVAPAVVTAGLTKMPATIASAIAAIGTPEAQAKLEAIEQQWASFEGTVRETDPDIYLSIEDQLDPVREQIKAGDTEAATATAATLSDLFSQYLSKHPG
jgi:iron uptake system EfeUOB component EfeO/EfeM